MSFCKTLKLNQTYPERVSFVWCLDSMQSTLQHGLSGYINSIVACDNKGAVLGYNRQLLPLARDSTAFVYPDFMHPTLRRCPAIREEQ